MLYNVLNYPAGSMPVTKVTADDVINMKDYPTKTHIEKTIHKVIIQQLFICNCFEISPVAGHMVYTNKD